MLYFDHCASTPPHEEVIQTLLEVTRTHYANPASIHQAGADAEKLIQRAKSVLAAMLGGRTEEWTMTSGGTESNNLAIKGIARQYETRGKHLITTQIEHASVYESFRQLEREGFHVTYLPVDGNGQVRLEDLRQALTDETTLVSIMHVNNEMGAVQPLEEIGRLLALRKRTYLHVDAVQSIGKLPIELDKWGVDALTASAHKLRGPKGVGFLYVREGVQLYPLLSGGGSGPKPGTANVPGIVAAAKAVRLAVQSADQRRNKMYELREQLLAGLDAIPELRVNGSRSGWPVMAPHIINFSYPGMKPEVMVHMLEENDILASTKSACSSKEDKPSRVLLAMGADRARASGGIRVSLGDEHDAVDMDKLSKALQLVVEKLRPLERRS
ncbi:cysteine desulfurase family protein [Paenibacillus sp. GCM10023252]|uniref:cysteine desulfurase family protein n=1 Tax=Paenibacillus sp. GCM10023252 TaxID=3252649 RepID=UPI00360D1B66